MHWIAAVEFVKPEYAGKVAVHPMGYVPGAGSG